jgi:ComF family protein
VVSRSETLTSCLFNFIFPEDCRVCEKRLGNISRVPVCTTCLCLPQPLEMEFFCLVCRTPFLNSYALDENGLCQVCLQSLENFDAAYSYGSYEGALQKLIQLFKYAKVETLAGPLSKLILQSLPFGENFDVVIAMPMHWRKRWERGFNQAELLAQPVARRYGLKLSSNLRRARYTKAQAGLNQRQRQANLKDSFVVRRPSEIFDKRVLLIDDVLTTGATLRAAAAALNASGAARVTALTLARVDHRTLFSGGERQRLKASGTLKGFDTSSASTRSSKPSDGQRIQTAVSVAK